MLEYVLNKYVLVKLKGAKERCLFVSKGESAVLYL